MIQLFYSDLRRGQSSKEKYLVDWYDGLTAFDVIAQALGKGEAVRINERLARGDLGLTVSWSNWVTEEVGGIGGVDSLDWRIEDHSLLTVVFEDETTTEERLDEIMNWMLDNVDEEK